MSDRTPQHQTTSGRGLRRIAVAALTATVAVLMTACEPTSTDDTDHIDSPAEVTSRVEFIASCDETGFAYNIEPDTQEARDAAQRHCRKTDDAIDNLPWPEGWTVGDVAVER